MESNDNTKKAQKTSRSVGTSLAGEETEPFTVLITSAGANEHTSINRATNPKVTKKKKLAERSNNDLAEAETASRVGLSSPSPTPESGETENKLKPKVTRHSWGKSENMPLGFPNSKAELTDDQIKVLVMQGPGFRKTYCNYFTLSGRIKRPFYRVIFEKQPDGEMVFEDWVISSNLHPRWESVMQRWEHHKERESSGNPPRKRQSKPSKKNEAEGADVKEDDNSPKQPSMKDTSSKKAGCLSERLCTPASEEFFESLPDAPSTDVDTDKTANIAALSAAATATATVVATLAAEGTEVQSAKPGPSGPSYRSRSYPDPERLSNRATRTGDWDGMFLRPERRRSRRPRNSSTVQNTDEAKPYDPANLSHSTHWYHGGELLQSIQQYEMNDLELMNLDDLSAFAKRMDRDINKVHATLMHSSESFGNWEVKKKVNELRTSLLALHISCLKLQGQLEADRMGEQ
ncbi:hypothetical protein N7476_009853 [Penicillium atrosanguineum]|uniref:Uncharacterized protein n=1 Tax=Penicillium atrosanguineum TaxID=1132637 RepID=A0A9W9PP28_9EURO|nr:hypothetical protein N7476_009853 [Penicillium atrosanguineum]